MAFVSPRLRRMSSVKLSSMLLAVMVVAVFISITPRVAAQVANDSTATDPPTPEPVTVATDPPTPVATNPPTPVATDPPTPVATDPPTPAATDPPTPVATNYCNISSCSGRRHVLCDDPLSPSYLYFLDPCVNTGSQSGVPTDDQKVIVDAYNTIRQWVKNGDYSHNSLPAAKTMPNVIWDGELAKVAQGFLNRCRSRHSCLDVPRFSVGHISHRDGGIQPNSAKDWKNVIITYWFEKQLQFFRNKSLIYTGSSKTLFQLIWAKTTNIGCGIMTRDGWRGEKHLFYFCACGPGIVKGEMSYEAKLTAHVANDSTVTDPPTPVATNYCNISSCSGRSHVLCDDPGSPSYYFLNHCYNTGSQSGVPTDDQKVIVDAYNTIRQWVKNGDYSHNSLPAAKTMPNVIWDDELAKVAQGYLNRCRSRHSCLDVPRFSVGHISHQDGGIQPHSAKDWKNVIITYWFEKQLQFFRNKNLIYTGSSKTLFQLIWAKTTKVGCGIMTRDGRKGEKHLFYFCACGPGIVKGEMSYEAKFAAHVANDSTVTDPPTPVATNYCNISSCSGRRHVLCDDPLSPSYYFPDHCNNTGSQSGVPTDDQKVIVDAHNTIRQWVKNGDYSNNSLPAAKTMPKVTWHDELAKVAQGYLNRCRSRHSCLDVPRFSVGHISHRDGGIQPHSAKDWKNIIITYWFEKQLQFFRNKNLIYTGSSKTLFQLIWAKTTKVGCGIMTRDGERGEKYLFYFCAYGPGIVKGEMSYEAKP